MEFGPDLRGLGRMLTILGFQGPAQSSPTLGDAINAGFGYLEVKRLGCNTHHPLPSTIVRRPN